MELTREQERLLTNLDFLRANDYTELAVVTRQANLINRTLLNHLEDVQWIPSLARLLFLEPGYEAKVQFFYADHARRVRGYEFDAALVMTDIDNDMMDVLRISLRKGDNPIMVMI